MTEKPKEIRNQKGQEAKKIESRITIINYKGIMS